MNGLDFKIVGLEIASVRQEVDGRVSVEGAVKIGFTDDGRLVGQATTSLTAVRRGLSCDIADLIAGVADDLEGLAEGYIRCAREKLLPLANRLIGVAA